MNQINLQFVKDTLSELDLGAEGGTPDDFYLTALVVFSALVCGPETARLVEFTQIPRDFVEAIRQRMIPADSQLMYIPITLIHRESKSFRRARSLSPSALGQLKEQAPARWRLRWNTRSLRCWY
jgi:hypothetical protein